MHMNDDTLRHESLIVRPKNQALNFIVCFQLCSDFCSLPSSILGFSLAFSRENASWSPPI